jgi:hypothetical protein
VIRGDKEVISRRILNDRALTRHSYTAHCSNSYSRLIAERPQLKSVSLIYTIPREKSATRLRITRKYDELFNSLRRVVTVIREH